MAVVPQIATVRANTQVQPFFQVSDLVGAVEGAQPQTHVTLHPGDYGAQSVEVPADVYVTALPGADVSAVTFTGAVANVTALSSIGGVNPDRVRTIAASDQSLTFSQASGDVQAAVSAGGVTEPKIADDAVTLPKVAVAGTPQVDQVVSYDGTQFRWAVAANLSLGLQSDDPVTGDGSAGAPFTVDLASTSTVALSVTGSGALSADIKDDSITEQLLADGAVTASKLAPGEGGDGQRLVHTTSSGLQWDTLTAEDVGEGRFTGDYTIDGDLQINNGAVIRGRLTSTNESLDIGGPSGGPKVRFLSTAQSDRIEVELTGGDTDLVVTFPDTNQFNSATPGNGYNGRPFVAITSDGGILLPMLQDQVADPGAPGNVRPPEGYMGLYAQEASGGNSQRGFISKIHPDGDEDAF